MKKVMIMSEFGMYWWFALTVPDCILRAMNKEQYYKTMSWVRLCRRTLHQHITPPDIKWLSFNNKV